jgi:hypothetical protein
MPILAEADAIMASIDANSVKPTKQIRFMRFSSQSHDCDLWRNFPA